MCLYCLSGNDSAGVKTECNCDCDDAWIRNGTLAGMGIGESRSCHTCNHGIAIPIDREHYRQDEIDIYNQYGSNPPASAFAYQRGERVHWWNR